MPDLVNLPASELGNDQNGHGVCKDMQVRALPASSPAGCCCCC